MGRGCGRRVESERVLGSVSHTCGSHVTVLLFGFEWRKKINVAAYPWKEIALKCPGANVGERPSVGTSLTGGVDRVEDAAAPV